MNSPNSPTTPSPIKHRSGTFKGYSFLLIYNYSCKVEHILHIFLINLFFLSKLTVVRSLKGLFNRNRGSSTPESISPRASENNIHRMSTVTDDDPLAAGTASIVAVQTALYKSRSSTLSFDSTGSFLNEEFFDPIKHLPPVESPRKRVTQKFVKPVWTLAVNGKLVLQINRVNFF